jgi:hypothetical protein
MSDIAIRVENLSKLYKISAKQNRHDTLRDSIMSAVVASSGVFSIRNPQFLARAVRSKLYWAAIRNKYAAT